MLTRRLKHAAGPKLRDRWIYAAGVSLLVWLPIPSGSHTPVAQAFFGLTAALLFAADVFLKAHRPTSPWPRAARVVLVLWGLWLGWIGLSLMPLPSPLLAWLSPSAFAVHSALQGVPGAEPSFTLSIVPSNTFDQWLLSFGYFCLFSVVISTTLGNRPRQRLLLLALVGSGLAQALLAIATTLTSLHGDAAPGSAISATGTFVNRNHFAGYMELTLSAGLTLVLADLRPRESAGWRAWLHGLLELAMSRRLRIRVMLVVMVIALVLTQSRMGNVAFFAALGLCGSTYMLMRHRSLFLRSLLLFASVFVVDLAVVSERYGLERVAQRLEQTDVDREQRLQVFRELEPVARRYWLTGAGLGAFAAAYSPARTDRVHGYYDHAHNDHLEFLIETGVIGYGLLMAMAGCLLVHGTRVVMRRSDPRACALGFVGPMGLSCLLIHGMADFNLQIPAVAGTVVALMALTLGCSAVPSRNRQAESPETVTEDGQAQVR